MQITIETITGKATTFEVEPTSCIKVIKTMIQDKDGIPLDQQRLIFDGKALQEDKTIADCNIQNGSIIKLAICVRK